MKSFIPSAEVPTIIGLFAVLRISAISVDLKAEHLESKAKMSRSCSNPLCCLLEIKSNLFYHKFSHLRCHFVFCRSLQFSPPSQPMLKRRKLKIVQEGFKAKSINYFIPGRRNFSNKVPSNLSDTAINSRQRNAETNDSTDSHR